MKAAKDSIEKGENVIMVSGDGSWRKREFTFLFGFSAIIGNYSSTIIDGVLKAKYCKPCEY